MAEPDSGISQSVTVVTTRREYGFYCWGLIVTLILLVLLIIVSAILLLTTDNTVLVISIFITVLIIVAVTSFIFIEWQRRQAAKRRDQGAREWINRTLSQDKLPTAPPESARSTSWMFWRKNSSANGSRLPGPQPSAPPHSARSSWTLSRQSYLPVYVAENRVR
ncbi:uncharacterized protein [Anabrus simplex]|uniref:uncharacterized protein n=1 Tax=Anabrus simplex TaxID=316456 RepID=UPI0034DD98F6